MNYLEQVQKGMDLLSNHPNSIFIGQATVYKGHAVSRQLVNYPMDKRLELPVAEDFQAGFAIGLALEGWIPISIYPRHDFVLLALNQIVTHLDKWKVMGGGSPKVIIKILVGAKTPLDGGYQHTANYIKEISSMCKYIHILDLQKPEEVYPAYELALGGYDSYIINEYTELYG